MHETLRRIHQIAVVPVVKIDDVSLALPLADALAAGGLPCAEITLRTPEGMEAIRQIAAHKPDMLVGAGTVLTPEQADAAIDAGARFLVSPGLNPRVVRRAIERGIPMTPGCATPSDMEAAMELGLTVVKFFPAEEAGGLRYIKAVSAPYHTLRFMPTGGITTENLAAYLGFPAIIACGGSYMCTAALIYNQNWAEITRLSQISADIAKKAREAKSI